MNIKTKILIILYVSSVLLFFVAKIYHVSMGYFYRAFPLIILILSSLLIYSLISFFTKKGESEHGKKYPPSLFIILTIGLFSASVGCTNKNEIIDTLENKSSQRSSVDTELEIFAKENKLVKVNKKSLNSKRHFSSLDEFKKAILDYNKGILDRQSVKLDIIPTIKTEPMTAKKSSGRASDSPPPCGTPMTNYNVNTQVYAYDGDANLNINLTYGVNSNGQYVNGGIQVSQFSSTTDGFTATTPQITFGQNGVIHGTFNTTQTNSWTLNIGTLFNTNLSRTTLTRWHYTYNPCASGSSRVVVEYEMVE
jgi:hypothetical protein